MGRIASCASCAFFCFFRYALGAAGTCAGPNSARAAALISATASGETCSPSVRMYVIRPSPQPRPSYRACAADMVRPAPKPSFEDASCCMVLVVNGGFGARATSFSVTSRTTSPGASFASSISAAHASASRLVPGSIFPSLDPNACVNSAAKTSSERDAPSAASSRASAARTLQYSSLRNFSISNSRSHTSLSATLCTLPALSLCALGILRHSTPDSEKPNR